MYRFFFEFISANAHLDKQEQIIYNLIQSNENISKEELAIRINKYEKTVQRIISKLIDNNMVERVGSNKDGYWKILE